MIHIQVAFPWRAFWRTAWEWKGIVFVHVGNDQIMKEICGLLYCSIASLLVQSNVTKTLQVCRKGERGSFPMPSDGWMVPDVDGSRQLAQHQSNRHAMVCWTKYHGPRWYDRCWIQQRTFWQAVLSDVICCTRNVPSRILIHTQTSMWLKRISRNHSYFSIDLPWDCAIHRKLILSFGWGGELGKTDSLGLASGDAYARPRCLCSMPLRSSIMKSPIKKTKAWENHQTLRNIHLLASKHQPRTMTTTT